MATDLGTVELVAGQYGVEPCHFLGRQEPLPGRHPVAFGFLAGIGVVEEVSPKLGHFHHHGQHRHRAIGGAGALAHGGEPVPDLLGGEGIDAQMTEGGQDVFADHPLVGCQGPGLPVAGLTFEELGGEGVHGMAGRPGAVVLLHRVDEGDDELCALPFSPRAGSGCRRCRGWRSGRARARCGAGRTCAFRRGGCARPSRGSRRPRDRSSWRGVWRRGCGGRKWTWVGRSWQRLLVPWAARPVVKIGSGRGGVYPRKPCSGARRGEP